MDFINSINLTSTDLLVLGMILATGLVVTIVLQITKHIFKLPVLSKSQVVKLVKVEESRRLIYTLLAIWTSLGTYVDFILSNTASSYLHFLGKYGAWVGIAAVGLHAFMVSPITKKIVAWATKYVEPYHKEQAAQKLQAAPLTPIE